MNCDHDIFSMTATVALEPTMGGTLLTCMVCRSTAQFHGDGCDIVVRELPEAEDSSQLRIAEFEQQSDPPSWICEHNYTYPVGAPCRCAEGIA